MKRITVLSLFIAVLMTACTITKTNHSTAITKDQYFNSDGVKIRYVDMGKGEPVVLIHSFTTNLDSFWGAMKFLNLAQDYRIIAFDNRGHGKSGKPHGAEHYGNHMIDDVIRLLNHLDIEKAHIIGYSLGGFIALKFLLSHPERCLSAVIGGAGWTQPNDSFQQLMAQLADSLEKDNSFRPLIETLYLPDQKKPSEKQINMATKMLIRENDIVALTGVIRSINEWITTREELSENQIPSLAIIGEFDPTKKFVDAMEQEMTNLEVVVINGEDHNSCLFDPMFQREIKEFLYVHRMEAD